MLKLALLPIVGFLLLSGCAVGNQHAYHLVSPRLTHVGSTAVVVAVHDQRRYVVDGKKTPDFVGLSRGGFGNSFDVTTVSERPLAADVADRVARALTVAGYQATVIRADHKMTSAKILDAMVKSGATRLVLVQMEEWKSDTYNNTALEYDMTVRVFDSKQTLLGLATINGRDDLGGSFMNPPAHAKEAVPPAFQSKLEQLLNDPKVASALQEAPVPPLAAPAEPAPTEPATPATAGPAEPAAPAAGEPAAPVAEAQRDMS